MSNSNQPSKKIIKDRSTKQSTYYCDPERLAELILTYRVEYLNNPDEAKISEELGKMLIQIVEGLAHNPQFKGTINDLYRDEMILEGIYACTKAVPKCDPSRLNKHGDPVSPFSFFTTVARYAFYSVIEREKRLFYTHENFINRTFPGTVGTAEYNDKQLNQLDEDDTIILELMKEFEHGIDDEYETDKI